MKNIFLIILFSISFLGCKKSTDNKSLTKKTDTVKAEKIKASVAENLKKDTAKKTSFVLSCGSGCAMTYSAQKTTIINKQKLKVKFQVEMYVDEVITETYFETYFFIYNNLNSLIKIEKEGETEDFLPTQTLANQQIFTDFGNQLKNPTHDFSAENKRSTFKTYENNNDFFIKTFDVNKDGINDKIVCNKPYRGEDLFVFYGSKNKIYKLNLETTNFSEDGGNIIQDIVPIPNSEGLTIKTYFPDRGYYEIEYNLIPENETWILRNTVCKTMSDISEDAVKYICDISQNIDITRSGWKGKIKPIPDENERDKKCRLEN